MYPQDVLGTIARRPHRLYVAELLEFAPNFFIVDRLIGRRVSQGNKQSSLQLLQQDVGE